MKKPTARRRRPVSRAKPPTIERTDQLARVTALAEQVFGDNAKAHRWLRRPKRGLDGATPLASLGSEAGTRFVEEMLYRIDSGIFA
jgi:putative toxin-antitoxin system antitoxin component (TIGR02293 family)